MTFSEYTKARRSKRYGNAVDDEAIARFVALQPKVCPVCRCQVFDPFGMNVVIHDVAKCAAPSDQASVVRSISLGAHIGRKEDQILAEQLMTANAQVTSLAAAQEDK